MLQKECCWAFVYSSTARVTEYGGTQGYAAWAHRSRDGHVDHAVLRGDDRVPQAGVGLAGRATDWSVRGCCVISPPPAQYAASSLSDLEAELRPCERMRLASPAVAPAVQRHRAERLRPVGRGGRGAHELQPPPARHRRCRYLVGGG